MGLDHSGFMFHMHSELIFQVVFLGTDAGRNKYNAPQWGSPNIPNEKVYKKGKSYSFFYVLSQLSFRCNKQVITVLGDVWSKGKHRSGFSLMSHPIPRPKLKKNNPVPFLSWKSDSHSKNPPLYFVFI